jgi:hypothetical protein
MQYCIKTINREVGDYVYDLLTNPLSGHGCLSGCKICIDDHNMVPTIMEFDLDDHEVEALKKIDGVVDIQRTGIGKPSLQAYTINYQKVRTPDACFRNASYTRCDNATSTAYPRATMPAGFNQAPNHLYYSTNYQPNFQQNVVATSTGTIPAYSIDCQGVDIIVFDSGVDPSCEDLKDVYGNNLVQIFDWTQVVDGYTPTVEILDPDTGLLKTVPNYILNPPQLPAGQIPPPQISNYYVDWIGHGTAVASAIAGLKCGIAKNAKIYAINCKDVGAPFGYSFDYCLKLVIGFIYGKLNGLYGLNPRTPTVLNCSWTINGPPVLGIGLLQNSRINDPLNFSGITKGPIGIPSGRTKPITPLGANGFQQIDGNDNDGLLSQSMGMGGTKLFSSTTYPQYNYCTGVSFCSSSKFDSTLSNSGRIFLNNIPFTDIKVDEYFRAFLNNNMHVVVAAGNSNIDLNQQNPTIAPFLFFRNKTTNETFCTLRQMVLNSNNVYEDNAAGLAIGADYAMPDGFTYTLYESGNMYINYQSPNVGVGVSKNDFPLIRVGCVTPLGNIDTAVNTYDSGGYSRAIYNVLNRTQFVATGYLNNSQGIRGQPSHFDNASGFGILDAVNGYFVAANSSPTIPAAGNTGPLSTILKLNSLTDWWLPPTNTTPTMGILFNDSNLGGTANPQLRYGVTGLVINNQLYSVKLDTPVYVKSPYSSFGPDVDIYGVGFASWAGFSNQTVDRDGNFLTVTTLMSANTAAPYFRDRTPTPNYGSIFRGKFTFQNGTSQASPAVAGCLASFLQQNPRATNKEARKHLINTSIKGQIMTTARTPFVSSLSGTSSTPGAGRFGITFDGTNVTSINFGSLGYNINTTPYVIAPNQNNLPTLFNNIPWCGTFTWNRSTSTTHLIPTQYLRNTNYFWTSSFYDSEFNMNTATGGVMAGTIAANAAYTIIPIGTNWLYAPNTLASMRDLLFQCRFFSDSNNRVAQAHPLRGGVFYATTGTSYASAIYLKDNTTLNIASTKLQIGSLTTERVTHVKGTNYITSTLNGTPT